MCELEIYMSLLKMDERLKILLTRIHASRATLMTIVNNKPRAIIRWHAAVNTAFPVVPSPEMLKFHSNERNSCN